MPPRFMSSTICKHESFLAFIMCLLQMLAKGVPPAAQEKGIIAGVVYVHLARFFCSSTMPVSVGPLGITSCFRDGVGGVDGMAPLKVWVLLPKDCKLSGCGSAVFVQGESS